MPKCDRNGQADIWSEQQLDLVMAELSPKMRCLFSICRFTGCRVSEARQLQAGNILNDCIVFTKRTTKGEKNTRQVPINDRLQAVLNDGALPRFGYLFPGRGDTPITRQACDKALRLVCDRLGFEGFSTHSFRRTALTHLSNKGVPLRVVQEVSGHSSLHTLQRYLEVRPEQVVEAISLL